MLTLGLMFNQRFLFLFSPAKTIYSGSSLPLRNSSSELSKNLIPRLQSSMQVHQIKFSVFRLGVCVRACVRAPFFN